MKTNLKSFALGASLTIGLLGVYALAVNIPNIFASGDVISAAKMNENFAAMKTAVDALEAKTATLQAGKSLPARDGYNAYALISLPTGTPDDNYAFNPAGTITVNNASPGVYIIVFNGTHPPIRNVQVSPFGSTTNTCRINSWENSSVSVTCFTLAGAVANTQFTINVVN
jgi:hypothetical protein